MPDARRRRLAERHKGRSGVSLHPPVAACGGRHPGSRYRVEATCRADDDAKELVTAAAASADSRQQRCEQRSLREAPRGKHTRPTRSRSAWQGAQEEAERHQLYRPVRRRVRVARGPARRLLGATGQPATGVVAARIGPSEPETRVRYGPLRPARAFSRETIPITKRGGVVRSGQPLMAASGQLPVSANSCERSQAITVSSPTATAASR